MDWKTWYDIDLEFEEDKPIGEFERLFVYGTLKSKYWNSGLLNECELLEKGWLLGFEMWECGVPFVMKSENKNRKVLGEIYLVDKATLYHVDRLEGHPIVYRRTWIPDQLNGVWIYLSSDTAGSRLVQSGIFGQYHDPYFT